MSSAHGALAKPYTIDDSRTDPLNKRANRKVHIITQASAVGRNSTGLAATGMDPKTDPLCAKMRLPTLNSFAHLSLLLFFDFLVFRHLRIGKDGAEFFCRAFRDFVQLAAHASQLHGS